MRSFVTPIALSLVLSVISMSEGQSRTSKREREDDYRKVTQITHVKNQNGITVREEYSTGSIREMRIISKSDGRLYAPFGYAEEPIVVGKIEHHDGTTTHFFSGVNFEDLPVQGPKKRRKIAKKDDVSSMVNAFLPVQGPKKRRKIAKKDDVSSMVNAFFSSDRNLKGKEKVSTKEIDDSTYELVDDLFSPEAKRPWTKVPSVPAAKEAQQLRHDVLELQKAAGKGKKRKNRELSEKKEALKTCAQNGLNKYVRPRYEKTSQQFPEKSREWVRLKRDSSLATPEETKAYLECRHEKIKLDFPAKSLGQTSNLLPPPNAISMLDELSDPSTYSRDECDEDGYNDVSWITDTFTVNQAN